MRPVRSLFLSALLLVLALALAGTVQAAPRDPLEGEWTITGWEPGAASGAEPTYAGRVSLRKHGDGYLFEGSIDDGDYFGVGLFDAKTATLSLTFQGPSGEDSGLTVLTLKGDALEGRWLYLTDDEGRAGREVWKRAR